MQYDVWLLPTYYLGCTPKRGHSHSLYLAKYRMWKGQYEEILLCNDMYRDNANEF